MKRTDSSSFSHVLAAVQRTERLPGGDIRGLPNGQVLGGLKGLQSIHVDLAEAESDCRQERFRDAQDRVKKLEVQFVSASARWESFTVSLIANIRQGKQLQNLEKLKALKAAQINMQRLVATAQKAFQDLVTSLDHDAILKARGLIDQPRESATDDDL